MDNREICFDILKKIEDEDRFVDETLHLVLRRMQFSGKQDRAFITRLVEGIVERRITLDYIIEKFSSGKGKKNVKSDIRILLQMGIYQIHFMEAVPNRAAISETVEMVKRKGFSGLAGYVNALLRKVAELSEEKKLDSYLVSRMDIRYSTPKWICDLLIKSYGKENAVKILEDQFREHDTVIRCNLLKTDVDNLKAKLEAAGITVKPPFLSYESAGLKESETSQDEDKLKMTDLPRLIPEDEGIRDDQIQKRMLRISGYDIVSRIPGFRQGEFIIQDETSVYAISRIGIKPGDLVIDMCAAPGGKTLLAYELTNGDGKCGKVISRDISESKLLKIKENAERMGFPVNDPESEEDIPAGIKLEMRDALENGDSSLGDSSLLEKADEGLADVVIADVPCSGLGVIGRKNDIKYHTSPEGAKSLAKQGLRILENAFQLVKPGGRICYSTCTINPEENGDVVHTFIEKQNHESETREEASEKNNKEKVRLLEEHTFLQGLDGSDGFYYAILEK